MTASLAGTGLMAVHTSKMEELFPIVDTHQHLVDFKQFGKDWSHPPVVGNFGIKEYEKAIRGLNIVKAVYMEVGVPLNRRYEEALYAIELCRDKSNPTVAAIIKADLYMDEFKEYMSRFKNSPYIKGIRGGFRSSESILDSRTIENIRFLGEMNMSLDFIIPPAWFPNMAKLIQTCPGTQFQIDHCGNADPRIFFKNETFGKPDHDRDDWINGMKDIANGKNAVCKISGLVSRSTGYPLSVENIAPVIDHCFDIFGTNRVMFASDWPWCLKGMKLSGWVDLLKQVVKNRPLGDQKKLFYENAIRHYKI